MRSLLISVMIISLFAACSTKKVVERDYNFDRVVLETKTEMPSFDLEVTYPFKDAPEPVFLPGETKILVKTEYDSTAMTQLQLWINRYGELEANCKGLGGTKTETFTDEESELSIDEKEKRGLGTFNSILYILVAFVVGFFIGKIA